LAADYNDLATKSAKECALYERDLERAMESCDELACAHASNKTPPSV
jgi:hypothetical protein